MTGGVKAIVGSRWDASIVVVSADTLYSLNTVWDLKATQMNLLYSLVSEIMLCLSKLDHNATEAIVGCFVLRPTTPFRII